MPLLCCPNSTCCLFYGPRIPKSASSLLSTTRDEASRDETSRDEASRDEENEDEESTPVISSLTSPIEEGLPTAPLQEPGGESKLAIYASMIHTGPCIMFWMRAYRLRGQVGGGWALVIESFLAIVKWHGADRGVPFEAQKTRLYKS